VRILHLIADWKWTGPAEPVLILARALADRGHEVLLSAKAPPKDTDERENIVRFARERAVAVDTSLAWDTRTKPDNLFGLPGIVRDRGRLRTLIDRFSPDVINAHTDHDQIVAALARPGAKKRPLLVRSDHKRDSFSHGLATRILLSRADGLITFSGRAAERLARDFKVPSGRLLFVDPALDLDRWRTDGPGKDMRKALGIKRDALVVGMVARFQRYRKTDRVIGAFARLCERYPKARLLLLGRSSQMEQSVFVPARRLGIADRIVTPGYVRDGYREALVAMDVFVFMVPGSDGTARALREAMALGLPVVAADVGMIGEIVWHEVSGLVVEPTEGAVASALERLLGDPKERKRLGDGAAREAARRFDARRQAEAVERFYRSLSEEVAG
jgi:glycosyltransferase involved in cell wall biosynthesis